MKTGAWLALAAVAVALVGGAGWYALRKTSATPAPQQQQAPASASVVELKGLVSPRGAIAVAAPLEGVLEITEITLGGEVLMGQIIGRIANDRLDADRESLDEQLIAAQERITNIEAQMNSAKLESTRATAEAAAAEAAMERTRAAAERQELLYKEGVAPRNTAEQARKEASAASAEYTLLREAAKASEQRAGTLASDLAAAQKNLEALMAALEAADENLRAGEVLSPADGILIAARFLPGDKVPAGTLDIYQIAPSVMNLSVALDPQPDSLAALEKAAASATPVQVTLAGQPELPFAGRLTKTPEGKWLAEFDTTEPFWKPGEEATVKVPAQ